MNLKIYRLFILVILLIATLCYMKIGALKIQTAWDDQWVVINYFTEAGWTASNLIEMFTSYFHGQYSPINQLYYTTIYYIAGYDPRVFHIAGFILHLLNILIVYNFINKTIISLKFGDPLRAKRVATLACLIFAIHPITVESVAWLSASKVLLYSGFYLLGLTTYLYYLNTQKKKYYILVFVFFLLSYLAKEQALVFPFALLLIDYFYHNCHWRNYYLKKKIPFFIISFIGGLITIYSQAFNGQGILSNETYGFLNGVFYGSYAIIEYLLKCTIPYKLQYLYPFPNKSESLIPIQFYIYPVLIFAITYGLWGNIRKKYIKFCLGFFLIHILTVIHILPMSRVAIIADRYIYISLVSFAICLSMLIFDYYERNKQLRIYLLIIVPVYIIYLGIYTFFRVPVWVDSNSIKKEARKSK